VERGKPNARFAALFRQAEKEWGWGFRTKMAKAMETTSATITNWEQGKHEPSQLQMDALSRALGNEEPYRQKPPQDMIIHEKKEGRERGGRGKGGGMLDRVAAVGAREAVDRMMQRFALPVISFARGGEGSYPEDMEHAAPRLFAPCPDPNAYVLELEGDSMEPIYSEGDLLVVAPNTPPINNDLVIVKTLKGEVFFKVLKHPGRGDGEVLQFHSYNPRHPPIHLRPDQIFRVSVVDLVIKPLKRKLRAMTVSESGHL
jgi:SOS-response transcriptional repressor LexA